MKTIFTNQFKGKTRISCISFLLFFGLSQMLFGQSKPNIVFILSDDAGYADFGFQGSLEFKTPELDKLANRSVKFTQAYVTAAVCGPSRAGMLTGKYQQKFGFEENNVPGYMSASGLMGDDMGLPLNQLTIANYLKDLGYRTAIIGKWHQGNADKFHPLKRGFDEFFGFRGGARSYFEYNDENSLKQQENKLERGFGDFQESEKYLTEALADEAVSFIERNKQQPFFMFLSFNAVHTPMQAKDEDLAKFTHLKGKRKQLAAMTLNMDRACGKVLKKLKELNLDRNTMVVFANDNGGPSDTNKSVNDPLSGTKANHLEGGIRIPFLLSWPGKIKENTIYNYPVSTLDLLPTFVNAAGGNYKTIKDIDGVNLIPFIKGEIIERPHEILYWKKENRGAIRHNDWKLIRFPDRPAELYNIENDISEINNVASKYPEKVKSMYKMLFNWELTLERPLWELKRLYEGKAMDRMDKYRIKEIKK